MPSRIVKYTPTTATTGNFNTDAAGTVKGGATVVMRTVEPGTLSALVTVDAETDGITLAAKWQVSTDNSTWVDVVEPYNPANVVLATGTAGADAAVTKYVVAPQACYGVQYARCAVISGAQTGAATDTYSIAYQYVQWPAWNV